MTKKHPVLEGLLQKRPDTFEPIALDDDSVRGHFLIESEISVRATTFDIRLSVSGQLVEATEFRPGQLLPEACPERHINPDHTFCIGLNAGYRLATIRDFDRWWSLLRQYLQVQLVAERTGRWPGHKMLSHGEAGVTHARALEIADRLGVGDDYELHLAGCENWITALVSEYVRQCDNFIQKSLPTIHLTDRAIKNANDHVEIHQPRAKLTRRKRERLIRIFAATEWQRADQEQAYWQHHRSKGFKCCNTMLNCPLRPTCSNIAISDQVRV